MGAQFPHGRSRLVLTRTGYSAVVPGNVSRYFDTRQEARRQPVGLVELAWDSEDPFVFNVGFDPSIVSHDAYYCTSSCLMSGGPSLPTIEYFDDRIRPQLSEGASIIDIGCGQGEFVEWLRAAGLEASGYDPVLRRSTPHLHQRYWSPGDPKADLLVMRCVLPHVPEPWTFLDDVWAQAPESRILIEYQHLDFIIEHGLWFQISHDHVNQFRLEDFEARYEVLDHGQFSGQEWQWVLVSPARRRSADPAPFPLAEELASLAQARHAFIYRSTTTPRPLAIWGGAGKGSAVAFALAEAGVQDLVAIDVDPAKHGKFMEGSGVQVISPEAALRELAPDTQVIVVNPNHVTDVALRVGDSLEVITATAWSHPG